MTEDAAIQPIRLAVDVADSALADRLVALLAGLPGRRLVAPGEPAEALVIASATVAQAASWRYWRCSPEGASNKAIARRLDISVHTAKFHVGSLLDKLDAVGRTDAVAHAARLGVIHL